MNKKQEVSKLVDEIIQAVRLQTETRFIDGIPEERKKLLKRSDENYIADLKQKLVQMVSE